MAELSGEFEEQCVNEAIADDQHRNKELKKIDNSNSTLNGPPPKLWRKKLNSLFGTWWLFVINPRATTPRSIPEHEHKSVLDTDQDATGNDDDENPEVGVVGRSATVNKLISLTDLFSFEVIRFISGLFAVALFIGSLIMGLWFTGNSDSIDTNWWYQFYPGILWNFYVFIFQCVICFCRKHYIDHIYILGEVLMHVWVLLIVIFMAVIGELLLKYLYPKAEGFSSLLFLLPFIGYEISLLFGKVTMKNDFMADQLCSLAPLLRSIQYIACIFIIRQGNQDYQSCKASTAYVFFSYVFSLIPYFCRAVQCGRKWYGEEGETRDLINLGKYVFAMVEAGFRVAYENKKIDGWMLLLVLFVSISATAYQLYWDFVEDWGLFQRDSKKKWLRKDLNFDSTYFYYIPMVSNVLIRIVSLLPIFLYGNVGVTLSVTVLELIRRGLWNCLRLENEHIKNWTSPNPFGGGLACPRAKYIN